MCPLRNIKCLHLILGSFSPKIFGPKNVVFHNAILRLYCRSPDWNKIPSTGKRRCKNCDHSRTCAPNLVNFGPQTRKWQRFSTHWKLISRAKVRCPLKMSQLVKDDQRLLMHTSSGISLSPAIFNAQNSKFGQKSGVLWSISLGSVGGIAPNFSAWRVPHRAYVSSLFSISLSLSSLSGGSIPQTCDCQKKSWELRLSWLSTSMLAMIKFVPCSPPGKIVFSTLFCRNFSAFRLKACMKALKATYSGECFPVVGHIARYGDSGGGRGAARSRWKAGPSVLVARAGLTDFGLLWRTCTLVHNRRKVEPVPAFQSIQRPGTHSTLILFFEEGACVRRREERTPTFWSGGTVPPLSGRMTEKITATFPHPAIT